MLGYASYGLRLRKDSTASSSSKCFHLLAHALPMKEQHEL